MKIKLSLIPMQITPPASKAVTVLFPSIVFYQTLRNEEIGTTIQTNALVNKNIFISSLCFINIKSGKSADLVVFSYQHLDQNALIPLLERQLCNLRPL